MNAIGQLILFCITGITYLLLFSSIASLLAKLMDTMDAKAPYWIAVIATISFGIVIAIHGLVEKQIDFNTSTSVGKKLLINIAKSCILLISIAIIAQLLYMADILESPVL